MSHYTKKSIKMNQHKIFKHNNITALKHNKYKLLLQYNFYCTDCTLLTLIYYKFFNFSEFF